MNKVLDLSFTQEAKRLKHFHSDEIESDDSWKDARDTSKWWMGKDFQLNLKDVWPSSGEEFTDVSINAAQNLLL